MLNFSVIWLGTGTAILLNNIQKRRFSLKSFSYKKKKKALLRLAK